MQDEAKVLYECPECDYYEIVQHCEVCPKCEAKIIFCEYGGHMVTTAEYEYEVEMCKADYDAMVERG